MASKCKSVLQIKDDNIVIYTYKCCLPEHSDAIYHHCSEIIIKYVNYIDSSYTYVISSDSCWKTVSNEITLPDEFKLKDEITGYTLDTIIGVPYNQALTAIITLCNCNIPSNIGNITTYDTLCIMWK